MSILKVLNNFVKNKIHLNKSSYVPYDIIVKKKNNITIITKTFKNLSY